MERSDKIDAVRRLANGYQAVIELVDELEKLGSVEQAIANNAQHHENLKAELAETQAKLQEARQQFAQVTANAEGTRVWAQSERDRIIAESQEAAAAIITDAKTAAAIEAENAAKMAEQVVADARVEAKQVKAGAARKVKDTEQQVDSLVRQHTKLTAAVEQKAQELTAIEASLKAMRDMFSVERA